MVTQININLEDGDVFQVGPSDVFEQIQLRAYQPGRSKTAVICAKSKTKLGKGDVVFALFKPETDPNSSQASTRRSTRGSSGAKSHTQQPLAYLSLQEGLAILRSVLDQQDKKVTDIPGFTKLSKKQQDTVMTHSAAGSPSSSADGQVVISTVQDSSHPDHTIKVDVKPEPSSTALQSAASPNPNPILKTCHDMDTDQNQDAGEVKKEEDNQGEEKEDDDDVNEFERQRLAQIARNRSRMAALQLPGLASDIPAPEHKSHPRAGERGIGSNKRSRAASSDPGDAQERRQSLRQRKIAPDPLLAGGVADEGNKGIILAANTGRVSIRTTGSSSVKKESEEPKERHPKGSLTMESNNGTDASDQAFQAFLKSHLLQLKDADAKTGAGPATKAKKSSSSDKPHVPTTSCITVKTAPKLKLKEGDVAKVTKDGVTHLQWHPDPGHLLIAAGDKSGQITLWQVDAPQPDKDDEDAFDGVAVFAQVHRQYISGLAWVNPLTPSSAAAGEEGGGGAPRVSCSQLLTTSYDGSLRLLDVQHEKFLDLTPGIRDDMEISAMEVDAYSNVAYLSDNLGNLEIVDLRQGKTVRPGLLLHDKRVNTLHLEPLSRRLLMSSGSDAVIRIWDVRRLSTPHSGGGKAPVVKPLEEARHLKSCHAAYWAPDGSQRVVSTSYDDTVRVWSPDTANVPPPAKPGAGYVSPDHEVDVMEDGPLNVKVGLNQGLKIHHNNQTGRWVVPFRAVWGPASDTVLVGNMKRGVDIFDASTGMSLGLLQSELMTAIPSRVAAHPGAQVIAAATSSGRVHVWR